MATGVSTYCSIVVGILDSIQRRTGACRIDIANSGRRSYPIRASASLRLRTRKTGVGPDRTPRALDLCFDHFGAKATGVIIHDRHTRALPGTSSETSPCPSSLFFGEHVLKNVEKRKRIENPRARSRAYLGTNRARVGTNQIISGTNPCLAVEPQ